MAEPTRRLALRVTLKLFGLIALLAFAYVLLSSGDGEAPTDKIINTTTIHLSSLAPDRAHRIEWQGGALQLLRGKDSLYLFFDRGGNLHCPLSWQPPGSLNAPQQPWLGGFRDQCSGTWYRYSGEVLGEQAHNQNLQSPPYRVDGDLLEIGTSGDNAAPAPIPAN